MSADTRTCAVVWDRDCQRPPGWGNANGHADTSPDEFTGPPATCYACGQDVCRACSRIRPWRVFSAFLGRFVRRCARICNACHDEARQHRRRRRRAP